VAEVAAEPVELPDHQSVSRAKSLEASHELRAILLFAGGQVLVEMF